MALQSSGAISMSQIKDEFGGTGSHALSEYYALAGLGVSGIPASGAISFSQFHGKSNQVTTSVWVTSGYNQTDLVTVASGYAYTGFAFLTGKNSSYGRGVSWYAYFGTYASQGGTPGWAPTYYFISGHHFYRGSLQWTSSTGNNRRYSMTVKQDQTTWIDTSGYENQTTTAQIST